MPALVYKKSGVRALCYKKAGNRHGALCYKCASPEVTIRFSWSPQAYVCRSFNAYHEISLRLDASFTAGSGVVVSRHDGGTETVFTIKVTKGPATFELRAGSVTDCIALDEDPGVVGNAFAAQRGQPPRMRTRIQVPREHSDTGDAVILINFNGDRLLTGVT